MLNLVIDGQIPTELAHMTIHLMLPDEVKDSTIASLEKCRSFLRKLVTHSYNLANCNFVYILYGSADHPDNVHCIIGHKMFKCMSENNLKVFFV